MTLNILFPDPIDLNFCRHCLKLLVEHLRLPIKLEKVMILIMQNQDGNIDTLIETLREEPALKHNCLLVVQDLVYFAVRGGVYDARMRVLIRHVSFLLRADMSLVELYEESVVDLLTEEVHELTEEDKKAINRKKFNTKLKRYMMVGLATLGGGAVIGLTGGLAAPLVAAGAGAIIGGTGAAVLGSAAGIAIIGSLFGVAGAGLTGKVGAVEEFAFDFLTEGNQLHMTIAISGWLSENTPDSFQKPWKTLLHSREQYCLRYESRFLLELGEAMDYLFSFAVSLAAQEALKYTVFSASVVTLVGVIDNPWGVCCRRSAEVGKQLADVLISRYQGRRPVTLIGFSLGARVIYYCLREMSKRKDCQGIIEDAILLGTPVPASLKNWQPFSRVVSGKIINGYCKYVTGHMDYAQKMDLILKAVGVRTRDEVHDVDSHFKKSKTLYSMVDKTLSPDVKMRRWKSEMALNVHCSLEDEEIKYKTMWQQRSQSYDSISSASCSSQVNPGVMAKLKYFSLKSCRLQVPSRHHHQYSSSNGKHMSMESIDSCNEWSNSEWDDLQTFRNTQIVVQKFKSTHKVSSHIGCWHGGVAAFFNGFALVAFVRNNYMLSALRPGCPSSIYIAIVYLFVMKDHIYNSPSLCRQLVFLKAGHLILSMVCSKHQQNEYF
ncbi:Transmembrane and coiled-coil domain-containing protein 4 [Nymphon striatum]|nr:Transmembrane and coiled-coil domain-containing protein 4 [Nymphon striatum]